MVWGSQVSVMATAEVMRDDALACLIPCRHEAFGQTNSGRLLRNPGNAAAALEPCPSDRKHVTGPRSWSRGRSQGSE